MRIGFCFEFRASNFVLIRGYALRITLYAAFPLWHHKKARLRRETGLWNQTIEFERGYSDAACALFAARMSRDLRRAAAFL